MTRTAKKKLKQLARRLVSHFFLIAGALIFALPFIWLVTTTFKEDKEIFVFPPKWIPGLPPKTNQSPFLNQPAISQFTKPENYSLSEWNKAQLTQRFEQLVAEKLTAASVAEIVGNVPAVPMDRLAHYVALNSWEKLVPEIPAAYWEKSPDELWQIIESRVASPLLADAVNKVLNRFAVEGIRIVDLQDNQYATTITLLSAVSPDANVFCPQSQEKLFPEENFYLSYSLGNQGQPEADFSLNTISPIKPDEIKTISLRFYNNQSFHRLGFILQTAKASYQTSKDFLLELKGWQELDLLLTQEPFTVRNALMLKKAESASSTELKGNELKLLLTVKATPYLYAIWRKFTYSYRRALRFIPFWLFTANSTYLVVLNILGQLLACSLVAFAFARLRWPWRNTLFFILIATMMLPPQVTMIPLFIIFKTLGWYNSLKPLWVPAFLGTAFYIFLLRQFFLTIPRDLEDAAKVDGCSYFRIYYHIMLPLIKPALATIAIFEFMRAWNDFLGPLIYVGKETITPLSLGLYEFMSAYRGEWGMLMSASTLMTIPVIAIFFLGQRYFIQGITLTGLKQ